MALIKTRFLVLSDTHGQIWTPPPSLAVDVVIHCGDLTHESKLAEFRQTMELLKSINAPLKLAIAGNHDFTLDDEAFRQQLDDANQLLQRSGQETLTSKEVEATYGRPGEARGLFRTPEADAQGLRLLDEGSHSFLLANGARLTVYASPYTPSSHGWAYRYDRAPGHVFDVPTSTDITITHGPPLGLFDVAASSRERLGCPQLFAAVARARPRMHCFGHVHAGWGAKLVSWRDKLSAEPSHLTNIDNGRSVALDSLVRLQPGKYDSEEDKQEKEARRQRYQQERVCQSNHTREAGERAIDYGRKTLFVNASIQGQSEEETQWPWLVDFELPEASSSS